MTINDGQQMQSTERGEVKASVLTESTTTFTRLAHWELSFVSVAAYMSSNL